MIKRIQALLIVFLASTSYGCAPKSGGKDGVRTCIIHGGMQAMLLMFDNVNKEYCSECSKKRSGIRGDKKLPRLTQ